jgi:hypothetical protein
MERLNSQGLLTRMPAACCVENVLRVRLGCGRIEELAANSEAFVGIATR